MVDVALLCSIRASFSGKTRIALDMEIMSVGNTEVSQRYHAFLLDKYREICAGHVTPGSDGVHAPTLRFAFDITQWGMTAKKVLLG